MNQAQNQDQYLAGEKININATVRGDITAGAENLIISDTVLGDLLIGAGSIHINAYIGDDARLSAGDIEINSIIEGDLVVFAGSVLIGEGAEIRGDLIAYAGEVYVKGTVSGNILCGAGEIILEGNVGGNADLKAGKVKVFGVIAGDMEMSAKKLDIGEAARCEGSVRYWSGDGETELSAFSDEAVYDEDLAIVDKDFDWGVVAGLLGAGIIAYWIIFILSTFMVLLLLEHFLGSQFNRAAHLIESKFVLSFGYGMLYFIGIPILSIIMFVIVIGFPIGVLTLSLYLLTLLFTSSICGLTLAHYFKNKYGSSWTYFQTVGYALLTVVVLKVIFWIPFLGRLLKIILAASVFGTFIMMMIRGKKAEA